MKQEKLVTGPPRILAAATLAVLSVVLSDRRSAD
jgi:hypothetical protein